MTEASQGETGRRGLRHPVGTPSVRHTVMAGSNAICRGAFSVVVP